LGALGADAPLKILVLGLIKVRILNINRTIFKNAPKKICYLTAPETHVAVFFCPPVTHRFVFAFV